MQPALSRGRSTPNHHQVGVEPRRGGTNRLRNIDTAVDKDCRTHSGAFLHLLDLPPSLLSELLMPRFRRPVLTSFRVEVLSDAALRRRRDMRNSQLRVELFSEL